MRNPIYQYNNFEDNYKDERIIYGRRKRFANHNLNRGGEFLNPNKEDKFSNSSYDKRGGYSNPDEFRISSFDKSLDIESLICIDGINKLFDMAYIFMKNHVKFVAYKFKRRAAT